MFDFNPTNPTAVLMHPVETLGIMPMLPTSQQAGAGLAVIAVGSLVIPALAGVAAAKYGRFSPLKAAGVSIGVSIVGSIVLAGLGIGAVAAS